MQMFEIPINTSFFFNETLENTLVRAVAKKNYFLPKQWEKVNSLTKQVTRS